MSLGLRWDKFAILDILSGIIISALVTDSGIQLVGLLRGPFVNDSPDLLDRARKFFQPGSWDSANLRSSLK